MVEARPRARLARVLRTAFVASLAVGAITYAIVVASARHAWIADVAASFRPQAALGLALAVAVLAILRARVAAAIVAVCALWIALPWLRVEFAPRPDVERADASIRLVTVNCFMHNREVDAFRATITADPPDVLAVQEWPARWREEMRDVEDAFPHRVVFPDRSDGSRAEWFGIGLYSRLPVVSQRVVSYDEREMPLLEMVVEHGGARFTIRAIHAVAPADRELWRRRNLFLERIARELAWDERTILVGDFNTSSGSSAWSDLVAATGLADSRVGFGWQPSWTTDQMIRGLRTDLDHVLVGADVGVVDRALFELPGSDHRGVTARLVFGP